MPSETAVKEYRIERLSEDNLSALEELHSAVYGRKPIPGYFQKKYDTGYTGVAFVGYVAYNPDNTVVAYYGVMPCLIRYGDTTILAAQSGDTMTHPLFRYKGMFVDLSRMTFDLCRSEGIKLLFGFPNQNSYHGAITKLGWKQTETMECFIIPVPTLAIAAAVRRFQWLQGIYRRYSKAVTGKRTQAAREMPNSVLNDGYNGIWRSKRYMQYRSYSDNRILQIGNALVWLKIETDMVIGDLVVTDAAFDSIIASLRRMAAWLGIRRILFQTCPGTRLHRLLAGRFPGTSSFPVLFQDFDSGLSLETIKFTFADIDIF